MRRRLRVRRRFSRAYAVAFLLVTIGNTLIGGCSAGDGRAPESPSGADTLANGLPRPLAPKLTDWVRIWRHSIPSFASESLTYVGSAPFDFDYAWPGQAGAPSDNVRARAFIDVLSPDSTRSLDFDMYLEFDRDEDGRIQIARGPDSAPVLADFKNDTLWRAAFCGTPCFYDGAYWGSRAPLPGGG